ncbi:tyrosine-protein phosphatase [Seonamhaeicola marinus]|uniref:protein-tyrosine-phosphatase n=1 Tax=Seonamhaeicola marinus TaxID=1912246 RepID=A0A5D0HR79_9FLAO|nr:CpsB/CapC family capsule biosynthesis tyrosine phosphatase [Seonamhaeicola marinus]TYA71882.1 histidinol phosphatase [Seonamhaeicola marinus]
MLNFFSKKLYLRDLLEGFVDIHNHILPGIDDGAKNTEESIALIKRLKDLGIRQFIPTPHVMKDYYPNTDESIGDAYQILLEALTSTDLLSEITINPAAEYMLDDSFEDLLRKEDLFTLKKKYVLVELSYFQPPINLESIIFDIKVKGYIPVLAHPERYKYYHNNYNYYQRLKQLGCLFQLNLLSLSGHYGKEEKNIAYKLLSNELIDFTGTDTHHLKHIDKLSKTILPNKDSRNILLRSIKNTNSTFSVT